ncbi:hypothetical protein J4G37_16835 [Microvirga sp. 3-52]|nr:hypothetical protein [Microvirga sp. 3-52]
MFDILVDLDGTTINSTPGIIGSYQHAGERSGRSLWRICPFDADLSTVAQEVARLLGAVETAQI